MSIDLSTAKAGNEVEFRCGETSIIREINIFYHGFGFLLYLKFFNGLSDKSYQSNGQVHKEYEDIFDIVKVN